MALDLYCLSDDAARQVQQFAAEKQIEADNKNLLRVVDLLTYARKVRDIQTMLRADYELTREQQHDFMLYNVDMRRARGCAESCVPILQRLDALYPTPLTETDRCIIRLIGLFQSMVDNYRNFGAVWRNIALAQEAFGLLKSLPPSVPGQFDTPAEKAEVLGNMLDQMEETLTPRFCIAVREYMQALDGDNADNLSQLEQLRDFIDPALPMEEYCQKYKRHLKFDPVERTQQWEDIIYEVEMACAAELAGEESRMGFCHLYWYTKEKVLRRFGINWQSPAQMNPTTMFD